MSQNLTNYTRTGKLIPDGSRLQEPIEAIKEIWAYLASIDGREEFDPQERFTAMVIGYGPPTDSTNTNFTTDYTDSRYWCCRLMTSGSGPVDPVKLGFNQADVNQGVADSLYITATNLAEVTGGNSHAMPTDGSLCVEVFTTWDVGNPQNKHYYFCVYSDGFWAQLDSIGKPSHYDSGSGHLIAPYAYAWHEIFFGPTTAPAGQTPPGQPVPAPYPGSRFGTVNGGTTPSDLGPAFNWAERGTIAITPAMYPQGWNFSGTIVWMRRSQIKRGNPGDFTYGFTALPYGLSLGFINGNDGGYGQYTGLVLFGASGAASGSNFVSTGGGGIPVGISSGPITGISPAIFCHLDEIDLIGWRCKIPQLVLCEFRGFDASNNSLWFFAGGIGTTTNPIVLAGGDASATWSFYETNPTLAGRPCNVQFVDSIDFGAMTNTTRTVTVDAMGRIAAISA